MTIFSTAKAELECALCYIHGRRDPEAHARSIAVPDFEMIANGARELDEAVAVFKAEIDDIDEDMEAQLRVKTLEGVLRPRSGEVYSNLRCKHARSYSNISSGSAQPIR
jgi:hypothetical protein